MDDLLRGSAQIQRAAEFEAEHKRRQAEENTRRKLMNRGDLLRIITHDDVIKALRYYAKLNYDSALERLLDPSKRKGQDETTENLRAIAYTHREYLRIFDTWEREGKDALKKLLTEDKSETNGE